MMPETVLQQIAFWMFVALMLLIVALAWGRVFLRYWRERQYQKRWGDSDA